MGEKELEIKKVRNSLLFDFDSPTLEKSNCLWKGEGNYVEEYH
jgi:hypothetical protein